MTPLQRARRRDDDLDAAVETVREHANDLSEPADLDPIVERASEASRVAIGEASHGTSEFYGWRATLTARLIREGEVGFVGVEGDWTDCHRIDRFVRGREDAPDDAREVLDAFDRWPTWMWANREVEGFLEWLREYNEGREDAEQVGFYGLDVYGLYESMAAILAYLEDRDPDLAERARDAYQCFEPYGEDAREYARSTRLVPESCEDEVVDVLADLRREHPASDGFLDEDAFAAEQNALVVRNAEDYYRKMARGGGDSWNARDEHMADTVDRLADRPDVEGSAVCWAHNTHVGDARATDMADRGKLNLGQLLRERHGDDVHLVGMGTHRGSVIAGRSWDAPAEEMDVPEATETSYGDVFHRAGVGDAALVLADDVGDGDDAAGDEATTDLDALAPRRGHRAIGVVYHPERELGNYVPTSLPKRYDSFLHVEETTALQPLHGEPHDQRVREPPETFPWGV